MKIGHISHTLMIFNSLHVANLDLSTVWSTPAEIISADCVVCSDLSFLEFEENKLGSFLDNSPFEFRNTGLLSCFADGDSVYVAFEVTESSLC